MANVGILLSLPKETKDRFYSFCQKYNLKPMRIILILMEAFRLGDIDYKPVMYEYGKFEKDKRDRATDRLKENRFKAKKHPLDK